jgi:hypothetical protein
MSAPKTWAGALKGVRKAPMAGQNDRGLCELNAHPAI